MLVRRPRRPGALKCGNCLRRAAISTFSSA
jgi:hypothetical protein